MKISEPINLPRTETINENVPGTITGFGLTYEGKKNQKYLKFVISLQNNRCIKPAFISNILDNNFQ